MNPFMDKILLAVAVLVAGSSAAFFMTQKSADPQSASLQSSTSDYKPILPAAVQNVAIEWTESLPADPNIPESKYDIFSPPKIYWHEEKKSFVFEGWEAPLPASAAPAFGVELLAIERELFRIQLESYVVPPGKSTDKAVLTFLIATTDDIKTGIVGDEFKSEQFKVLAFRIESRIDPSRGLSYSVPVCVIYDDVTQQEIQLTTESKLYLPDSYTIKLRATSPFDSGEFILKAKGESFSLAERETGEEIKYTLQGFDAETVEVTLQRDAVNKPEWNQTQTLKAAPAELSSSIPQGNSTPPETEKNKLDPFNR